MSASGTYAIAGVLLVIVVAAAAFGWSQVEIVSVGGRKESLTPAWTWLAFLLTFVVAVYLLYSLRLVKVTSRRASLVREQDSCVRLLRWAAIR
jgi:hypothetical protein